MDACVPPASVLAALQGAGLTEVKRTTQLGLFSEYTAVKGVAPA
jgi:demethylmenaquinone methyltransferase/2-methoxy-6-polyprenyl-1,4-benzoquinol methylase